MCLFVYLVTGHFVPRSFHTHILFSIWSFRTQFRHFVPSLVISYLLLDFLRIRFGLFVPCIYCFVPKSFRTRSNFVLILVKMDTKWPGYEMAVTWYEMTKTWVRNDQCGNEMTRVRNDLGTKWLETVYPVCVSFSLFFLFQLVSRVAWSFWLWHSIDFLFNFSKRKKRPSDDQLKCSNLQYRTRPARNSKMHWYR